MEQHFAINALHTHGRAHGGRARMGRARAGAGGLADGRTDAKDGDGPPDSETGGPTYTRPDFADPRWSTNMLLGLG